MREMLQRIQGARDTTINMNSRENTMTLNPHFSIITLNVNGLNAPTKRHRVAEWIKKQNPSICCLQETHFRPEDTFRLKVKGWRNIYHATGSQKRAGVAILISDKLDFKVKAVTRDEEGHYIIITGSLHQEELTIINIYAPNLGAPKYIKQLITERNNLIDKNVLIAGDFNTPLTAMDRSTRQKITKETMDLNDTLEQMELIDIFRTLHPEVRKFTFFSSAHGTFSKIDHILGHKAALHKYKRIEIIPCTLSDHNAMKLEINHRKKSGKPPKMWRLKTTLLKNDCVNQAIREEIKKYMETNENENTTIQNLWDAAKAVLRGKYIAIQANLNKLEKVQIQNLTEHLLELEGKQQEHPKPSRRKEIIKIRAEINNIESKRTVEQINETKSWFFEKINKIDKPLARLLRKKRESTQIDKIMNEEGSITTNPLEIQAIIRDYYEKLYANKLDNTEEMDKFLNAQALPKFKWEEIESMNRPIASEEI